ncbi:PHP domain-containing protein [Pleionea sp. CnH1-48]|uniref:PHP domain-containing protein n=1 Tax=Pleionea sp. CnH1-48 TaxID=2954494 RepID=UPI002097A895|nr:PHP domain-containing protein [Pleionea sp. CnH1-48]MCO7226363.1 PHP domain-containing protein [Pleionea sp. CnH1-48]
MIINIQHDIDLHAHTHLSDGKLPPVELVGLFREAGVTTMAITDHDSIGAHLELSKHDLDGIEVIPGVEISCSAAGREIHVVGLDFDLNNAAMLAFLAEQQQRRRERIRLYGDKLESLGLEGVNQAIDAVKAESITRTHLAEILIQLGYAKNNQQVFKRYLGRKARAYVKIEWPSLEQAVAVIKAAGGTAVLAHPGRYQLSNRQLKELIRQFKAAGGQGIELTYSNIDEKTARWLLERAEEHGLFASQGSDFHDPAWPWVKPGRFPALKSGVEPVWSLWQ